MTNLQYFYSFHDCRYFSLKSDGDLLWVLLLLLVLYISFKRLSYIDVMKQLSDLFIENPFDL